MGWLSDVESLEEKFNAFVHEKVEEKEKRTAYAQSSNYRMFNIGKEDRGTESDPRSYVIRFLPPKNMEGNKFYMQYHYHMYKGTDSKWHFIFCPKTYNFNNFCPFCALSTKLYTSGNEADKKLASSYKRKPKYVANVLVIDDDRDAKREKDDKQVNTVRLYEFPMTIEKILSTELEDKVNGAGFAIFNPSSGLNFILRVGVTKQSGTKEVWPDYKTSKFSNKPTKITEYVDINEIEEQIYDLNEYIKSVESNSPSLEEQCELIKGEALFGLIAEDARRFLNIKIDDVGIVEPNNNYPDDPFEVDNKKENVAPKEEINAEENENEDEDLVSMLEQLKQM